MPKGKKPWKTGSKRAGMQKKYSPKSWEEKMEERKKLKALKERIREAEEKKKAEVSAVSSSSFIVAKGNYSLTVLVGEPERGIPWFQCAVLVLPLIYLCWQEGKLEYRGKPVLKPSN